MRRRRIIFVAVLALLVVGPGAAAILSDPKGFEDAVLGPRSETVPVVETVGQLRRCRPVTVEGTEVRLGISADEGPAGSALVLYALVGPSEHAGSRWEDVGPAGAASDVLGPLWVTAPREARAPANVRHAWPLEPGLYATDLPLAEPGPVTIALGSGDGREVARRTVRATDAPWHPFVPFGGFECGEPLPDGVPRLAPLGGAAVPRIFGDVTRTLPGQAGAPLPRFEPAPEAALTLAVEGELWTVSSPHPRLDLTPETCLLARWWVDGRPVSPRSLAWTHAPPLATRGSVPRRAPFHVHVDRALLGASPGARIEVQVLACPEGWRLVDAPGPDRVGFGSSDPTPVLSNRVLLPPG